MSEATLKRIEKAISKLAEQQDEICAAVAVLQKRVDATNGGASREEVLGFLDQFRAGEALGRGVARRLDRGQRHRLPEGRSAHRADARGHARAPARAAHQGARRLARGRGARGRLQRGDGAEREAPTRATRRSCSSSPRSSPTSTRRWRRSTKLADRLDHDPETQSLLRTIVQDERSTLEFLSDAGYAPS